MNKVGVASKLRAVTSRLVKIPGAVILFEPLRKHFAATNAELIVSDFDGDLVLPVRLNEHMESRIFWYGRYNRDVLILLRRLLQPGNVLLDIGANIGEIAMVAAKAVGSEGRIYAFEPAEDLADRLQVNIDRNQLPQISIIRKGLSNACGRQMLYASEMYGGDGMSHSGMNTLHRTDIRSQPIGEIELVTADGYFANLDLDHVDGIKIDVEGSELAALEGARRILVRHQPWIVIEVNEEMSQAAGHESNAILQFLAELGYSFQCIGRKGRLLPFSTDNLNRFHNVLCVCG